MRAAEQEANLMQTDPNLAPAMEEALTMEGGEDVQLSIVEAAPMLEAVEGVESVSVPSISRADVQAALSTTNIGAALKRMADNPDEIGKMMEESMKQMGPDAINQARKMALGGQGDQIRKEMARRGLDPNLIRKQYLEQQRNLRGTGSTTPVDATAMLLITTSRQLKSKNISQASIQISASSLLHAEAPVELTCSRLAKGPLSGKTIKVWYDPTNPVRNRRASKIIGFPVGGDMLVVLDGAPLTEKDFLAAEKFLA